MGYESILYLIDVRIKPESAAMVTRALANPTMRGTLRISDILDRVVIDSGGFLAFSASEDGDDQYVPDEDDGTVPALSGKWYEAEDLARWLRRYCDGGRIVLHSAEGDGDAWGWEFDGKGRMRALALVPTGKWEHFKPTPRPASKPSPAGTRRQKEGAGPRAGKSSR